MFSAKDTLKVPMKRDKGLKKAAKNNLLFFAKRCRSRSFFNITQLTSEERIKEFDGEGENFFGYGAFGQRFEFTPQDYSIVSHYTDQKKLYEDMISPTVVVLTRWNETNKVRKQVFKFCDSFDSLLMKPPNMFFKTHIIHKVFKSYILQLKIEV